MSPIHSVISLSFSKLESQRLFNWVELPNRPSSGSIDDVLERRDQSVNFVGGRRWGPNQ